MPATRTLQVVLGLCGAIFVGCREAPSEAKQQSSSRSSPSSESRIGFRAKSSGETQSSTRTQVSTSLPSGSYSNPGTRAGSDWPCFLGPDHNSVSREMGIISPWPEGGLRIVWYRESGRGYAAPSIDGDRLFLFDRLGNEARLRALDRKSGESLWTFKYRTRYVDHFGYSNGPRCCPVIDDGRMYIHGVEGMLYCVDVKTGEEIWKVNTFEDFNVKPNFFGVGSTPLVEGDLLIVQIGGSAADDDEQPNGTGIVAFDKRTGKVKYKMGDELASYASPVPATIGDRRWCFMLARGGLIAFDPQTGKQDFHFPWRAQIEASVNASNPVIVDDKVLISECYGPGSALLKVTPGDYEVLRSDKDKRSASLKAHWVTPIYCDGYLYGDSGYRSPDASLRCVDFKTGKVKWEKDGFGHSSLLLVDGHLVCLTEYGELRLLKINPEKYDEVSSMEIRKPRKDGKPDPKGKLLLDEQCWAAPVLSHGLLYLRGTDYLVCLELIREP
jgi:outer membrane protein assembly factor BamB